MVFCCEDSVIMKLRPIALHSCTELSLTTSSVEISIKSRHWMLTFSLHDLNLWRCKSQSMVHASWNCGVNFTRLKDGDSVQGHIKAMTEIFDGLSVAGAPVSEEDRVVHLLASLPESYNMLVTAFEANPDVPKMEVVTERLLHEEQKQQDRAGAGISDEKAMTTEQRSKRKGPRCHYCRKFGHIKRDCYELAQDEKMSKSCQKKKRMRHKAYKVEEKRRDSSGSGSETVGLVVKHALSASASGRLNSWVVDSGATSHMCNDDKLFVEFRSLKQPQEVALGDGHALEVTGHGTVALVMKLPDGKTQRCKLHDVLYVPKLSYNLLSVSKATEAGKTTKFSEAGCQILDVNGKLSAEGSRVGSLYYLDVRQIVSKST